MGGFVMEKINEYIKNVKRVEFTVTHCCTSKCKHCSVGDEKGNESLDIDSATDLLEELSKVFEIESVMTFGGEPLLVPDITCAIHKKAKECDIPVRQIITNGFFSKDNEKINNVAALLVDSGVNDIMLSVDCFHEEFIPLPKVYMFAEALNKIYQNKLRLHPAWVINEENDNSYNRKTKECISYFDELKLKVSSGNNIFPAGNALKYLSQYFKKQPIDMNFKCGQAPYTSKLTEINQISVNPNGDIIVCSFPIGNIRKQHILDIISNYDPFRNPYTNALLHGGISELLTCANNNGMNIDSSKFYTPCDICHEISKNSNSKKSKHTNREY